MKNNAMRFICGLGSLYIESSYSEGFLLILDSIEWRALKRSSFENGLKIKDLKNSPYLIKDIFTPTFNSCIFTSFYKERK
ncbi:hypothetical protein [Peribacillus sp. NPDC097895]|uniref:hypothetical protein n=1 Tax=Peribacillus sp. NPDC097895 TaxID=3390619 RepID=UPI003D03661C